MFSIDSNALNNFFAHLGSDTTKNKRKSNRFLRYLSGNYCHSFFLSPTSPEEIHTEGKPLKNENSVGFDNKNMYTVKSISSTTCKLLSNIINLSFLSGIVPYKPKIARITSLFKLGDKFKPNNYRPISILPSILKY